jgi:hypothetical protein
MHMGHAVLHAVDADTPVIDGFLRRHGSMIVQPLHYVKRTEPFSELPEPLRAKLRGRRKAAVTKERIN